MLPSAPPLDLFPDADFLHDWESAVTATSSPPTQPPPAPAPRHFAPLAAAPNLYAQLEALSKQQTPSAEVIKKLEQRLAATQKQGVCLEGTRRQSDRSVRSNARLTCDGCRRRNPQTRGHDRQAPCRRTHASHKRSPRRHGRVSLQSSARRFRRTAADTRHRQRAERCRPAVGVASARHPGGASVCMGRRGRSGAAAAPGTPLPRVTGAVGRFFPRQHRSRAAGHLGHLAAV